MTSTMMTSAQRLQDTLDKAVAKLHDLFRDFCRAQHKQPDELFVHEVNADHVAFLFDDCVTTKLLRGIRDAFKALARKLENIEFDGEAMAFRLSS